MPNQFPEVYIQLLTSIIIIGLLVGFVAFITLLYKRRKAEQKKEMELLKTQVEKELLTTKLEIQQEIEQAISMEMHDNVGQTLLLASVNLAIIDKQMEGTGELSKLVQESKLLITKSLEDITSLSRSMNPDRIVETGVFSVIENELSILAQKGLFQVSTNIDLTPEDRMSVLPEIQIIIFRIYQEAIKNTIKYAEASEVSLDITKHENQISFSLKDNGKGFDTTNPEIHNGIGLRNMKKRVRIFAGALNINAAPGYGTTIQMLIPAYSIDLRP